MSDDLKVGDVAIVVYSRMFEFPVGCEVVLLAECPGCTHPEHNNGCWIIRPEPFVVSATRKCLRKKRPPQNDCNELGSWELCPWQPADRPIKVEAS